MIEGYRFGRIEIDGKTYTSDVIVYPHRVDDGWWRKKGHRLCMDDLRDVGAAKPGVLIIGTGAYGMMTVPDDLRRSLSDMGVELRVARTGAACKMYNEVASDRNAVAALHLTC